MSDLFKDHLQKIAEERESYIRPEIRALVERGNITSDEFAELRCNSWERDAIVPALTDEAFVEQMKYTLENCFTSRERPCSTYNQALEALYAPELLKRFAGAERAARDYAGTIDNVREALGQKATHYLIIADDVRELVEAIEFDATVYNWDELNSTRTLKKIRKAP